MTNPDTPRPATQRRRRAAAATLSLALLQGAGLALITTAALTPMACKKAPPPPPPPPPPAPPPPKPQQVELSALMQTMGADPRVQFPQEQAPVSDSLARAIISLASGFAKGDAQAVKSSLDRQSSAIIDELLASGGWEEGTAKVEGVRVVFITPDALQNAEPAEVNVVLAIQEPGAAYILAWSTKPANNGWSFKAMPSTGQTRARAAMWDNQPETTYADSGAFAFNAPVDDELAKMLEGLTPEQRAAVEEAMRQNPDVIRKSTPGGPITIPNPGGPAPGGRGGN